MRIKTVQIKNFRTLKDVEIDFDSVTTFIGPNGSGKSSVLRALDWFFNGGKSGSLSDIDCSFGATSERIEVRVTFDQLTVNDREALGKYATDSVTTFTAWKRREPSGEEILSANAKGLSEFSAIKAARNATDKRALYKELLDSRPDLGLPPATTGAAVDAAMTEWESDNIARLVDIEEELQTNFFGFNSGGKLSGLFDFVLVTADLRATEESQDAKTSIVGRILERTVDRSVADEEIAGIVEASRLEQQRVYKEKFEGQLAELSSHITRVIEDYSPGRSISVTPSDLELKPPKTSFSVSVIDGNAITPVENQGHGFQRTLLISALQVLAQSGAASEEGVICLAIEEPELFQHPIQAQAFARVLRSLAENASNNIQVTYATHSPYFIEPQHFHQVRRLTRKEEDGRFVTVRAGTPGEVKARLDGVLKPTSVDKQLDGIVSSQLSIALFANRALLVEGTTDAAVFYGLGDRESPGALELAGVSVVSCGSKSSIPLLHAILETLGIPTYTLFDADAGFEKRAKGSGKAAEKIEEERNHHIRSNRTLLRYFGQPEVDFPTQTVGENVAVLEDTLETLLNNDWTEWSLAHTSLEKAAGISLSKNNLAYRKSTCDALGEPPAFLTSVFARAFGQG